MLSRFLVSVSLVIFATSLCNNNVDGALTMTQLNNMARGVRNTCVGKTGADPDLVEGMHRGDFPEDEKLQCYTKCVLTAMKALKNGRIDGEALVKQIRMMMPQDMQDRVIPVVRHCVVQDFDENPCIAGLQFTSCQYKQDPEVYFFP